MIEQKPLEETQQYLHFTDNLQRVFCNSYQIAYKNIKKSLESLWRK